MLQRSVEEKHEYKLYEVTTRRQEERKDLPPQDPNPCCAASGRNHSAALANSIFKQLES